MAEVVEQHVAEPAADDDADDAATELAPAEPTPADETLLFYFTSGTTSKPKLVEHTHTSYPVGHLTTVYWIGLEPGDVHLNVASPGWAKHAWSNFFAPWIAEATIFVHNARKFDPAALMANMERYGVTSFCAPPTVWRMLIKAARPFAAERWAQEGFRASRGAHPTGTTMRNLFGQVDGTGNPAADTPHLDRVVWGVGAEQVGVTPWIADGTSVVIRRIEMLMDTWDELDRPAKEKVIGRRLGTGAPLTGEQEHDEPDFDAVGPTGFPVISDIAHLRRARGEEPEYGMLRRGYNYDDPRGALEAGSGLIFAAYQADVDRQFVPVQARLAESDHLNLWTVPVGSAVFAIPPGCAEGGFVGDALFA